MFKLMKVFDSTDMPDDVRKAFFQETEYWDHANDTYISWYLELDEWYQGCEEPQSPGLKLVNEWLLANGAVKEDEMVIVKRWW